MARTVVIISLISLTFIFIHIFCVTGKGDTYSTEEELLLPMLLERVAKDLTQDYMFHNRFLVRFLRAKNMNVDEAEAMIRKTLKWRAEKGLETILSEDFSRWTKRFPFYIAIDLEGRPGIASGIHGLDFRNFVVKRKVGELIRYIYYALECSILTLGPAANASNTEFIKGHLLFNLDTYTPQKHACVACIPYYISLAQHYEMHYPELSHRIIGINGPRVFGFVVQLVRPYLTLKSVKVAHLYGYNKAEWQRKVLQLFPAENLTPEFGGTLKIVK